MEVGISYSKHSSPSEDHLHLYYTLFHLQNNNTIRVGKFLAWTLRKFGIAYWLLPVCTYIFEKKVELLSSSVHSKWVKWEVLILSKQWMENQRALPSIFLLNFPKSYEF